MIATFRLQLPTLLQALRTVPSTRVDVEEMNTTPGGEHLLLVWVESEDYDGFETAMADDPTVAASRCLMTFSDRRLYQVEHVGQGRTCIQRVHGSLVERGAMTERCIGTYEGWTVRIVFPDYDALRHFRAVCEDCDVGVTLLEKYEQADGSPLHTFGLSEKQRTILLLAAESGYFEVPRGTDLSSIADELGISHQAASERLRRAIAILVDSLTADLRDGS